MTKNVLSVVGRWQTIAQLFLREDVDFTPICCLPFDSKIVVFRRVQTTYNPALPEAAGWAFVIQAIPQGYQVESSPGLGLLRKKRFVFFHRKSLTSSCGPVTILHTTVAKLWHLLAHPNVSSLVWFGRSMTYSQQ